MSTKKDFEEKFDELGKDIETLKGELGTGYRQEKENLKERWDHLDTKMEHVEDAVEDIWEDMKDDMEEGLDNLRGSYDQLQRRMRHEEEE